MYISKEQTVGCFPIMFSIAESPRHLETKYELIFWFGDYPIIVKRSNNRIALERAKEKIIKQSKITSWKKQRSKDPKYWKEPWKVKTSEISI